MRRFAASVDGTLLDDATWNSRHRRIATVGWAFTAFALVYTVADGRSGTAWVFAPLMTALMLVASSGRPGRRPREVAVALTFVAAQVFLSRYVGNITGFGAIYIIVLSFYQDWVPITISCLAALALVTVAVLEPSFFADDLGFAQEEPLTGMSFRALAIIVAAVLALVVWRSGTQIARDQLTGLLSRAGAERTLDRDLARGRRPAAWVCDVDNFRSVNAELGPAAGDLLLRHVADELGRVGMALPGGGVRARLGADTFLIATHDDPGGAAFVKEFAHRIEGEGRIPVAEIAGHDVPVRLSVGATSSVDGETAADLVRAAEHAMREAKGQGEMRVVVERRQPSRSDGPSSLLISELYRACERGEFELYLQPVVSLADGLPVGAESLVRWNHPQRGLLYPASFLPEAERDSALMAELSGTLGAQFADLVAELLDHHGADWLPGGFGYNLAAIRLRDPTLPRAMAELLAGTRREDRQCRITLEVTEGALMEIEQDVPTVLAGLREPGYEIALDDFGTGYSSLAHLRDFPLDTVKIDMSFIQAIDRSPTDRAVVQAVTDIAAASGLSIVAEGVETPVQRDVLMSINPDMLAQGWLYAKAMPAGEFEAWVAERKGFAVA